MRWVMRIGGVLVAALVALLVLVLIPAQIQVRGVEPALPDEGSLRALLSEPNGPVRVRFVNTSTQEAPGRRLGHIVFLVEWADGRIFMVDAGMDRDQAIEFGRLMETAYGADEAVSHGDIAALLGDDLQKVEGAGFTHLHVDHTQGVVPFCVARGRGVTVYQTPSQAELHNFNTEGGAEIIAESCLLAELVPGQGALAVEGFPGLVMVPVGGHTPGSTIFAIAEHDRIWILSGDTTNTKANLLSNTGKGFLYSQILVPENTERTERLRLWLTELDAKEDMTVVVSHDLTEVERSGMLEYGRAEPGR
jgi:glyoxylase-like metal-dependent hydrolase (beta-lactamase superfamily II)